MIVKVTSQVQLNEDSALLGNLQLIDFDGVVIMKTTPLPLQLSHLASWHFTKTMLKFPDTNATNKTLSWKAQAHQLLVSFHFIPCLALTGPINPGVVTLGFVPSSHSASSRASRRLCHLGPWKQTSSKRLSLVLQIWGAEKNSCDIPLRGLFFPFSPLPPSLKSWVFFFRLQGNSYLTILPCASNQVTVDKRMAPRGGSGGWYNDGDYSPWTRKVQLHVSSYGGAMRRLITSVVFEFITLGALLLFLIWACALRPREIPRGSLICSILSLMMWVGSPWDNCGSD